MFDEAFNKLTRVVNFDKKFDTLPDQNSHQFFGALNLIKDSYFGNAIFIMPEKGDMVHDVICVSRDASRLARRFKIQSLNFKESRGVQAGDALYVFFFGEPVQVKKISNLPDEPII